MRLKIGKKPTEAMKPPTDWTERVMEIIAIAAVLFGSIPFLLELISGNLFKELNAKLNDPRPAYVEPKRCRHKFDGSYTGFKWPGDGQKLSGFTWAKVCLSCGALREVKR